MRGNRGGGHPGGCPAGQIGVGGAGRVQVIVKQPTCRGGALGGRFLCGQQAGLLADELVTPVPAAERLVDQVVAKQPVQAATRVVRRRAVKGGGVNPATLRRTGPATMLGPKRPENTLRESPKTHVPDR